jgi:flagellar motor switch protein FliN/FliY
LGINNLTENQIKQMLNIEKSVKKAQFSPLEPVEIDSEINNIDILKNVEVDLEVELGETFLSLGEILDLKEGSVIGINKMAGDTIDIFLNKIWLASGEVVVINDVFGIRISSFNKEEKLLIKQG